MIVFISLKPIKLLQQITLDNRIFLSNSLGQISCKIIRHNKLFSFQKWAIPGLFFFIFVFSIQLTANKCSILKFANDWIRTTGLWYWKRPLYQLSHNHRPNCLVYCNSFANQHAILCFQQQHTLKNCSLY